MWRLSKRGKRGRRERGAVSVVVALSLVIVMGFVALAVDLGSMYSDRQQLQNGADAAALAIAQSCQRDATTCTSSMASATADKYAKANKLDGQATVTVVLDAVLGTVQVKTGSTHVNWFAGILGAPTSAVGATASAVWGVLSGGKTLPLAFSWCSFKDATGGWDAQGMPNRTGLVVVNIVEHSCTPPAHNEVPGGFGSLSGVNCSATVLAGNWVTSDPGNNGPNSCVNSDWTKVMGKDIDVPIFEEVQGTGSNATYKIKGVATFTFTGICLGPDATLPATMPQCPSNKRIEGTFTKYTNLDGAGTIVPGGTDFGTRVARLSG